MLSSRRFAPYANPQPFWKRLLIALTAVALALLFKWLIFPDVQNDSPFLIFFTAVVFSAWYGGLAPGLLATMLAALLADYFFLPPTQHILFEPSSVARVFMFAFEGVLVSILSHMTKLAYTQARTELEERKRTEQALAASEERFRLLVERVQDYAIFMISVDGIISTWNLGAERLKGYSAREIIGQPYKRMFLPEDVEAGKPDVLLRAAREQGHVVDEGWRARKDGTTFWAYVVITAMRDDNGTLRGYSKITRDMTERHQSREALAEALEHERHARIEAEKADALKLQFLAMISHELRTPLTSIKGFTSTLLADDVQWDLDHQREFIRIMDVEADKLTALIEQLLNVSRLNAGTFTILPTSQPLRAALDAALPSLTRLAAQHELRINVPESLPNVAIDAGRIAQVLSNLVDNASRHAPPGSPIEVNAVRDDGFVRVDVRDYGVGVPPDMREKVFEAFQQVQRKSGELRGAGLGLAIVRGIIEGHGGKIWIEDTTGAGTQFSFTLPVVET